MLVIFANIWAGCMQLKGKADFFLLCKFAMSKHFVTIQNTVYAAIKQRILISAVLNSTQILPMYEIAISKLGKFQSSICLAMEKNYYKGIN